MKEERRERGEGGEGGEAENIFRNLRAREIGGIKFC